jgi:ATP-binding cassette subfamily C protein
MGVVVQNGQLTRGSIMKNILGAAGGKEEDAWRAAAAANLDEDIKAMPMRMQTMVDPTLVSGGQAQRILLARALARNPRVVLLDEATSALDNESQARVSEALDSLGATRIVVAHRLSTIVAADRIIVIAGGKAVQQGTYEELLAQPGEFAELAKRQLT